MRGFLSDRAVGRLRSAGELPDFSGTRYRLKEFVARGGMGAVYEAHDQILERRVAIKVLDGADPRGALAGRLRQEARVLARLEHPGIVPVHDAGSLPDGRAFYVMKFVQGARLDQFIAGVPSLSERLRLFLRVCDAVSFAHSRAILHRDLKPSNIMAGAFGELLVMDWGLAKILRPDHPAGSEEAGASVEASTESGGTGAASENTAATQDGVVLGTPGFMPPEQAQGKSSAVDERSDIFSLGKLLEFVMKPPAGKPGAGIPKALRAICARACAANPVDRYRTVSLLAEDISRFLDGLPVSAHRENPWERTVRFYYRYQAAILLVAAYLVMRTLFVLYGRR